MREMPECYNRKYKLLDDLISELSSARSRNGEDQDNDPGVKLMCEFWNILKEDPDCNLTQAVRQRMGLSTKSSSHFKPQNVTCYMASKHDCTGMGGKASSKGECKGGDDGKGCCTSKSMTPKSTSCMSLSKVLCNLKEAVSFDKKCNDRISELMATQEKLQEQIKKLEANEKDGTELLKQADCMWSCMEDAYKKKVADSVERQNIILKQMKEVETSNTKWRKNKKDLEFQLNNVNKCANEIKDKIREKTNDSKCLKMEIANFKKRAESSKKEAEAVKKSFANKKAASVAKTSALNEEINRVRKIVLEQERCKAEKEQEGSRAIKEAREDLQKIYRVLLQKKLENEDLRAEKEAVLQEIDVLKKTCDQCKDKCMNKHKTVAEEMKKLDAEIAGYKVKCIKCHVCTDTSDARKFCTDCPRCTEERDCLYKNGVCTPDAAMDCVCMSVKHKFMDNVFENMYNVLERQIEKPPGKAIADVVLNCLKNSRNGKLNDETKKILQDFVLTTVKKNLNLTIIGGAVKTRCEMDPDTYKQLMLCLKQVKVTPPPKADKGTTSRKDPCGRWGGTNECNCPKGPKACICTKKAPPLPNELVECALPQDKEDAGEVVMCPHQKKAPCGADCAMHAAPSATNTDTSSWRSAPCDEKHCTFSKSMRAAQCVLGPESLAKGYAGYAPNVSVLENQIVCKCGTSPMKPCPCQKDAKLMKGGYAQCNEDTCAIFNKLSKQEESFDSENMGKSIEENLIEKITKKNEKSTELLNQMQDFKNNLTLESELKTPQTIEKKNVDFDKNETNQEQIRSSVPENKFKVSINKENGEIYTQLTQLHNTASGFLAMELDEDIVNELEQKLNENPIVSIGLQKTISGQCLLDFSPPNKDSTNCIMIKRSVSGGLLFEVDKSIIETLENKETAENIAPNTKSSVSISITMKHRSSLLENTFDTKIPLNVIKAPKHACSPNCSKKNVTSKRNEDMKSLKDIYSGNYKIFKLNLHDKGLTYPPAILKLTSSQNYVVIIDKEYESNYNDTIRSHLISDYECPIAITKTNSGTYVIEFVDSDESICIPNALLVRSESGNIKILGYQVDEKRMSIQSNTKSITSSGKRSSKIFSEMLNKFPNTTKQENSVNTFIMTYKRSHSESNLYEKSKIHLKNQQRLLTGDSATFKRTSSGQYTVVLDKESKKTLINKLKKYLSNNSQALIPIKMSESGEITILFSNDVESDGQYGSLKVSPSGNIYLVVDKNCVQNVSKDTENKNKIIDKDTKRISVKAVREKGSDSMQLNLENKAVTTTCNGMPGDSCDSTKCVCADLFNHCEHVIDFKQPLPKCVTKFKFCPLEERDKDGKNIKCLYKPSLTIDDDTQTNNAPEEKDQSPRIVIKQYSCPQKDSKSSNQELFYLTKSVGLENKDKNKNSETFNQRPKKTQIPAFLRSF